ncbi:MAG: O-antigen ligase family protein [Parcubacteria group bacterium]|jgi:O-antigen ligase
MLAKFIQKLFYIFIFFLSWQTVFILREVKINNEKFQYGTLGIYFFELLLSVWLLLNIVSLKKCSNKKILFSVLIFIGYSFLSIFWAYDKLLSLHLLFPLVLGALSFLVLQEKLLNFKVFTFSLILSTSLHGLLGLYQFFTQSSFSNKWLGISEHIVWQGGTSVLEIESARFLRAYGGMLHPNILGGFLMIAILLGLCAYLKSSPKENYWKYFLLITLLVNFSAFLVTFSRSAFIALLAGLFFILTYYLYHKKIAQVKKLLSFIFIFIVIGIIFLLSFFNLFFNRITINSRLESKSIKERIVAIKESQELIYQNPFLGTGIGNYTSALIKNKNVTKEIWHFQPVHNIYLLIFSELGIFGFSFFLFIVIFIIWDFFESFKKEDINRVIFSVIIVSLLILSLFDHWVWTSHSGIIIFWLLLGFSREKNINYV